MGDILTFTPRRPPEPSAPAPLTGTEIRTQIEAGAQVALDLADTLIELLDGIEDGSVGEAQAKRRLADEYDAAQERGEVAAGRPKSLPGGKTFSATVAHIGLTHKQVHEARQLRNAEAVDPGVVRRTLDDRLSRGGDDDREGDAPEIALPEVAAAQVATTEAAGEVEIPPLRWGGRGNCVAAAGVVLLDLVSP